MKTLFLLILISLSLPLSDIFAYVNNYPPYKFKEGPPKHIKAKLLVDSDRPRFKSKDGRIFVRLKEAADSFDFLLKDGKLVLARLTDTAVPLPNSVYQADLDGNGIRDFIVFYNYRGSGLESQRDRVDIFLKKKGGTYQKISFDTFSAGIEDFVDLDGGGKWEVIITDFYSGHRHNYFTYNIYKLKDYRLLNADIQYKGFPKFVWMTYNKNDKDTSHLTKEERLSHTDKKNNAVQYQVITGNAGDKR